MMEQWQIDQGEKCPCGGADDMCSCQNTNRTTRGEVRRLGEREIRQAIAHYLSRQGSDEYDPKHVFLRAGDGSSRGWHASEFEATAIPRPTPVSERYGAGFLYLWCPECEWDCVIRENEIKLGTICPTCAGDTGRDVLLRSRCAKDDDVVEGRDARKEPS